MSEQNEMLRLMILLQQEAHSRHANFRVLHIKTQELHEPKTTPEAPERP